MNKQEWLACDDARAMWRQIRPYLTHRKARFCVVGICRLFQTATRYPPRVDDAVRHAIEIAECYADGGITENQLALAQENTILATSVSGYHPLLTLVWRLLYPDAIEAVERFVIPYPDIPHQVELLREIVGPIAFRPAAIDPAWLTWRDGTIPQIAQTIYDERHFADMPVLADALEEAGCTNADMLQHCRQPGEHVRGCWVVDLLLGTV